MNHGGTTFVAVLAAIVVAVALLAGVYEMMTAHDALEDSLDNVKCSDPLVSPPGCP